MINPPIDAELLKKVRCRYELVVMASKRARQLTDGSEPMVEGIRPGNKPVTIALGEISEDKVYIESRPESAK